MENNQTTQDTLEERVVVDLPSELVTEWGIKEGETLTVIRNKNELKYIHNEDKKRAKPQLSTLIAGGISFLILLASFWQYHQIPLTGHRSIATGITLLGVIFGVGFFTYNLHSVNKQKAKESKVFISIRHYPAILTSYGVMLVMGLLFIFKMLSGLFYNASFDIYTASFIGALFVGIIVYLMSSFARTVTPLSLIRSFIIIILCGVSIAMITNRDQQWWLANFSFLGTPEATQSWKFNLTLMLSALLMIALIDYLFLELYGVYGKTKQLITLKVLLIATAICLGGVGFFPYNESHFYQQMHNRVAGYLVYLFIVLIILAKWIVPEVTKEFLRMSYFLGGILVLTVVFFIVIPYLSLTAFELVSFVLAFTWLLTLLQDLIDKMQQKGNVYEVTVSVTRD